MFPAMTRLATEKTDFRPVLSSRSNAGFLPEKIMGERRQLTDHTFSFLERSADLVGQLHKEIFSQFVFSVSVDSLDSPIEDLFFIAVCAMSEAAHESPNIGEPNQFTPKGVFIRPQVKIGAYRVDFVIEQKGIAPEEICSPIVVELDGHDFHDKNKKQRSYEKARDRYLTRSGYKVLHFTGSDVHSDPFKCAHEALDFLGVTAGLGISEYNPENPLGIE